MTPEDGADLASGYRNSLSAYQRRSTQYLAAGDYQQAAEKSWGAFALSVKAIAADYGSRLSHHGHIVRVGNRLSTVAGQTDESAALILLRGLNSAISLHQHFYENNLEDEGVALSSDEVAAAIDLMQQRFAANGNGGPER